MLALVLSLFSKVSLKDWLYGAIIAALLVAFGVYTHHERSIGAAHETAVVTAALKAQDAKVAAINSHNETVEAQANAQVQALSGALATANSDLASRLHNDAGKGGSVFVPSASCTAQVASNAGAAQGGTSVAPESTGPAEVTAPKQVIEDDLTIALDHNLQLQAIITEFQQIQGLSPSTVK